MIYWVFFWNFESEKFSNETKNFQAKIKIGQAELMNGQVFKSTFRTLILSSELIDIWLLDRFLILPSAEISLLAAHYSL